MYGTCTPGRYQVTPYLLEVEQPGNVSVPSLDVEVQSTTMSTLTKMNTSAVD